MATRTKKPARPVRAATPACEQVFQVKLGAASAYERFLCGGHLVYWTGKDVKSVDVSLGREVGKAKADVGAPWLEGDEVWIPTSTGFEARTPSLSVTRAVRVPAPKTPAGGRTKFGGAAAHVHGTVAYRVARSAEVTNVGGELRQDYYLHAYDLATQKQRYLRLLKSTAYPQVHGKCSGDRFAIEFRTDDGFEVLHGSTSDGAVAGSTSLEQSQIVLVGSELFQQGVGSPVRILRDGWRTLDCTGDVRQLGDHLYCIGHREIVRLEERAVAARAPVATPPAADETARRVPTSACLAGDSLMVIERCQPVGDGIETMTEYRALRRDPVSLRELGPAITFSALPWLNLVAYHDGIYVAAVTKGFVGLRI